jgi:hypothetical protein
VVVYRMPWCVLAKSIVWGQTPGSTKAHGAPRIIAALGSLDIRSTFTL